MDTNRSKVVLQVVSDGMGVGDEALGGKLMTSFFNVLPETGELPEVAVFYNTGVRLLCEGSPVLDPLRELAGKGMRILACGTCLNHFELKDQLAVGEESNMFAISQALLTARSVVQP